MCGNWLLGPIVSDINSVASEMFVQGFLCLAHILLFTTPAFNQIDYALSLASGTCALGRICHW